MMERVKKFFMLFFSLLVLFSGCWFGKANKPSVIFIVWDTVRQDHLSLYGYFRGTTPFLEKLAKESVVFTQAYTPISHTLPAHFSMFTSRYPSEHGVLFNGWKLKNWKYPLLAEVLRKKGWQTGAVVGSQILGEWHRINPGFKFFKSKPFEYQIKIKKSAIEKEEERHQRRAKEVINWAKKWLSEINRKKPFFLFLHFWDAHRPYYLPEDYPRKFQLDEKFQLYLKQNYYIQEKSFEDINEYDNAISYLDEQLRSFFQYLKEQGLLSNTLIILTADHGEGLGQHNWYGHGLHLYQEQLRVPLLIRFPDGWKAGARVDAPVSLIDLAPTILEFLNLKDTMHCRGKSLLPLIKGTQPQIRDCQFAERRWYPEVNYEKIKNWAPGKKCALVCGEWKYLWADKEPEELYNLAQDPLELNNLIKQERKKYQELRIVMHNYIQELDIYSVKPQRTIEEVKKVLKSLGYVQ